MPNWLKSVWNLLPAILGVLQSILPFVKDVVVAVVRIIAVLPFAWSIAEPIIEKINGLYDVIYAWVEKIKNAILLIPR